MGKPTDGIRSQTQLGSWAEFDMKFNEDAIYCSGISHGSDSTQTFINALRVQQPVEEDVYKRQGIERLEMRCMNGEAFIIPRLLFLYKKCYCVNNF